LGVVSLSVDGVEHSAPPLEREKLLAVKERYQLNSLRAADENFDAAYEMLDSFFGPRGELEEKQVLAKMIEQRDIWFAQDTLFTRYHILTALHQGALVGVRDCYTEIDPKRKICLIALSHSFIAPEHRRTGLAALFRELPVMLAKELCRELFSTNDNVPILVTAEMEPAEPTQQATMIRYISYGRAGFSAIDPTFLPYSQPDFRDLDALGFSHVGIPLVAVIRWVGHEAEKTIPVELASAFPRHYNGFHYRYTKRENVDAMIEHALSTLAQHNTKDVPLLPLPTGDDVLKLTPLLKSRVLPLYPALLRGEHQQTLPFEEELERLKSFK
jgi:hypothetical protein